jgi:hypothetical protein
LSSQITPKFEAHLRVKLERKSSEADVARVKPKKSEFS